MKIGVVAAILSLGWIAWLSSALWVATHKVETVTLPPTTQVAYKLPILPLDEICFKRLMAPPRNRNV